MHPPHIGLFQTLLFEIYFQSRRLFLGMDVIGSFTSRDVFVAAAPSVLSILSQRNLSNFVGKFSTGSRDDSPGRVDSPSWQLTFHCHSSEDWPTASLLAGEL